MYLCFICNAGTPDTHAEWCAPNSDRIYRQIAQERIAERRITIDRIRPQVPEWAFEMHRILDAERAR